MRVTAHWRHYLAIHQTHVCIIDWRDTSVMCGLIIITIITLRVKYSSHKYSNSHLVMFIFFVN